MMIGKSILFAVVLVVLHVSAESCSDGIKNLNEVDVDCGGVCGPCAEAEEVTTAEPEAGCKYEPADECDADWECNVNENPLLNERDEYGPVGEYVYDYDCKQLPNCPMVPDSSMGEDYRCESDSVWFASNNGMTLFNDAQALEFGMTSTRPEGTSGTLDNCGNYDVYKVVCPAAEAEEVTTAEPEAEKVCSYVPQNDCLDEWDCQEQFYVNYYSGNSYLQTEDEEIYDRTTSAGVSGFDLMDGDCNNLPACPLTPSVEDEGIICESDAVAFMVDFEYYSEYFGHYNFYYDGQLETLDVTTRPEGTVSDLDNCKTIYDVYEVVCTVAEAEEVTTAEPESGVTCTYEAVAPEECPNFDCDLFPIDPDEYFIDGLHYDYDCNNIGECPMVPTEADEGLVCEADAQAYMAGGVTNQGVEADLSIRPEGTSPDLDNCKLKDVYRVVCVAATTTTELETTTTELETTTSAPTELCETYVTAASCPASYCVIKNDRHGDFKKCKRIGCKTFDADETSCDWSAECQPKYKKDGSFKKCLLKKNLV